MRNGLNTSNMSEFVNEIKTNPKEALFRYRSRVELVTPTLAAAAVQTLGAGSIRVARAFRFDLEPNDMAVRRHPSPNEYLLTALGGCVIVTFVLGCSARGITLTDLEIIADARVDPEHGPLQGVRYAIHATSTADDRQLRELVEYVSCLSPNHRTFVDQNDFGLEVELVDADGKVVRSEQVSVPLGAVPAGARADTARDIHAHVKWRYGTQMQGEVSTTGQRCRANAVRVDQPKQSLGLDWAANPQEDLLAVVGAELLHALSALARSRGIAIAYASTMVEGSLDLRGLMNVEPTAPVRVHDIRQKVTLEADQPFDALLELASQAAASTVSRQTICREGAIDVTVVNGTQQIATYRSDREFTTEYLRRLAEMPMPHPKAS